MTRRKDLASVLLTRTYHSADCDTDHSLVASKVRIVPRKLHHKKKSGRPRINTGNAGNPLKIQSFLNHLNETLEKKETSEDNTTDLMWSHLQNSIYSAAISAFGK